MTQQDPRVDRSRGAVYQAEDSLAAIMRRPNRLVRAGGRLVTLPPEVRFGSLEAIQAFVDLVLADARVAEAGVEGGGPADPGPVVVRVRRGFRMATYSQGTISIPAADPRGRWALTRSVVLHEVAHHLTGVPGHGRRFRATLVALYRRHLGPDAADLLSHLFAPIEGLPEVPDGEPGPGWQGTGEPGPHGPNPHGQGPHEQGPEGQVRRVAALLAKAESTASAEEAEAYLAKAALVAARHSVDMAVAALSPDARGDAPTHRMLTIGEPRRALNRLLVSLLVATARAWSVRVDIGHGSTYVLVYGMPADLDRVEAVFATASAMMVTRAREHVRGGAWKGTTYRPPQGGEPRPVTGSVARNAFCLGFIGRFGRNLEAATRQAREGALVAEARGGGAGSAGGGNAGQGSAGWGAEAESAGEEPVAPRDGAAVAAAQARKTAQVGAGRSAAARVRRGTGRRGASRPGPCRRGLPPCDLTGPRDVARIGQRGGRCRGEPPGGRAGSRRVRSSGGRWREA